MSEGDLVLVTGASGYLAVHVVNQLQNAGYRVRGTVRNLNNETKVKPLHELCPDAKYPLELVEADLLHAQTWHAAVNGCKYVIHTASPLPFESPDNEEDVIKPALEGTLNVLEAVKVAKCVHRVVITSSMVAVQGGLAGEHGKTYTEQDWTDPAKKDLEPYAKAKTLAEKAAWDFVAAITDVSEKFELSVMNPGYICGPVLSGVVSTSLEIPKRMMEGGMPMLPHLNAPSVDVRDVAAAHVIAMTHPEAAGKRHILVTTPVWFKDFAQFCHDEFHSQGYSISRTEAPYFLFWIIARFDKGVRLLLPMLGKEICADNSRMLNVLKIKPYAIKETYIDMVYSMIERGMIKKTASYRGRD